MTRLITITKLLLLISFSVVQTAGARENKLIDNRGESKKAGHAFLAADSTEPSSLLKRKGLLQGESVFLEANSYDFFNTKTASKVNLGVSNNGSPVEAFYFPGKTGKRALIIGGVHGSELSSIEVAKALIKSLQEENFSNYEVIVIPCLFPDNALAAASKPALIGSVQNVGRYTGHSGVDPNRQMPSLGKPFFPQDAKDHLDRTIERENQLLLNLIASFRPERIVNLHAIRNVDKAGVYADPRTDATGIALGFAADSILAVSMAKFIEANGGRVEGNQLQTRASARYPNDPEIAPVHTVQRRAVCGSSLPDNRGCGVSLGSWASTAVQEDSNPVYNRDAITLITMEFPGYRRPSDYASEQKQRISQRQVEAFALSIKKIFLEETK